MKKRHVLGAGSASVGNDRRSVPQGTQAVRGHQLDDNATAAMTVVFVPCRGHLVATMTMSNGITLVREMHVGDMVPGGCEADRSAMLADALANGGHCACGSRLLSDAVVIMPEYPTIVCPSCWQVFKDQLDNPAGVQQ